MSEGHTGQRRWTPEEEELLRSLAAEGASVREMAERLPGRTMQAICNRLHDLGLSSGTPRKWSEAELDALVENEHLSPSDPAWRSILPKRTPRSIYNKLRRMREERASFTDSEREMMRKLAAALGDRLSCEPEDACREMLRLATENARREARA